MSPIESSSKGTSILPTILIAVITGLASGGAAAWFLQTRSVAVTFNTPYQAVLLNNGAAYFGKLEGLGKPFPTLHEVYYIQTREDPNTKQRTNVLVKRGQELHGPDHMVLNAADIVFVEPVNPNSRVAELIAEAKQH